MDYSRELKVAVALAREAGGLIRDFQARGLTVDRKAGNEPVTEADRQANTLIVAGLRAAFAEDGLLSEEAPDDGSRLTHERVWMVNPLDGTKDFIRGESGYATMIGLLVGDRPRLGVVYQPAGDRLYTATPAGAWLQIGDEAPQPLRVSEVRDTSQIRMVASKSHREAVIDQVRAELGITDELNVGSVGLKLGLIARGERDLYVNPSGHSKLWDACGPEAILVGAGGRLTDAHGDRLDYRGPALGNLRGLIASNGLVHDEVVARLRPLLAP